MAAPGDDGAWKGEYHVTYLHRYLAGLLPLSDVARPVEGASTESRTRTWARPYGWLRMVSLPRQQTPMQPVCKVPSIQLPPPHPTSPSPSTLTRGLARPEPAVALILLTRYPLQPEDTVVVVVVPSVTLGPACF
ncbi:hypothetical protein GGTG_07039 [Gaeumannomyces tritici R3-111a-1]|uniref:Uncharacterized protein n=1 Tax=Gaeumannomyces tritici (strain R3-111a-1) TaxID=644352 RepID=J3P0J4_GAET3|nr:hypothetical protein GGTG_07039 [Gaeumannomyces tritici R3-111a-1]EJT77127.1 hypothetical protein GGTG_07039 [Gaeumannomyces tritici R3-111a-1]